MDVRRENQIVYQLEQQRRAKATGAYDGAGH
jgi:hypothetical protein